VRRGFAHLFDHQLIIDEIYEGNGYVVTMPMPAAFLGYNPDVPVRTLDLEAAEQYFRAAFGGELWEKGFEFTALHNAGNTRRQTALEVIKSNLEFLNPKFRMNVRGLPWSDFLARTGERKTPMFALGWGADYADPKNFINTFLDNDGFYSGRTSVDFPEIQALIDQADSIVDPAERAFLYKEIGILVYDLVPILPLPEQANYLVVSDRLEGVYYNPIRSSDINFLWKDISKN
jgi:peptide/nickel transport system substrate-binding protein